MKIKCPKEKRQETNIVVEREHSHTVEQQHSDTIAEQYHSHTIVYSYSVSIVDPMKRPDLNSSILSGASDIVVVKGDDGIFRSTPFTVRLGLTKVTWVKKRVAVIFVNGTQTECIMSIDNKGLCYFESEIVCFLSFFLFLSLCVKQYFPSPSIPFLPSIPFSSLHL